MKINVTEIKVGMILEYKDDLWEVLKINHVKPGKGGAFAQVEMKSLNKNTKLNERFRSSETVEKANIEETKFNYLYSDDADYYFMNPKNFDIILACNFLGDIFSDLAATISGSLGMLPSASLCGSPLNKTKGIYEPVHGTAPELVGTGTANPIGMILSISMMLKFSFGLEEISKKIELAIDKTLPVSYTHLRAHET